MRTLILSTLMLLTGIASSALAEETSYTEPMTKMEFVYLEGGTFVMGDILRKDRDASPPHRVTVEGFWIGKYEVTFAQYDAFCEATKRDKPDDNGWGRGDRPVIHVSWKDAVAYADWLSAKTGEEFNLPSEAQWEYAARGGKATPYWWGPKEVKNLANCFDCGSPWDNQTTAPAGSLPANPWGLHEILGNVNEWVYDKAHEGYEDAPADDRPKKASTVASSVAGLITRC